MADPHDLQRFVDAQEPVFDAVVSELRTGRKRSHWMWFVFPQLVGLGNTPTATRYAIRSRSEARAYLQHPVLGPRLRECARLASAIDGKSDRDVFGYPDDLKLRSSMTLFAWAAAAADDDDEDGDGDFRRACWTSSTTARRTRRVCVSGTPSSKRDYPWAGRRLGGRLTPRGLPNRGVRRRAGP